MKQELINFLTFLEQKNEQEKYIMDDDYGAGLINGRKNGIKEIIETIKQKIESMGVNHE